MGSRENRTLPSGLLIGDRRYPFIITKSQKRVPETDPETDNNWKSTVAELHVGSLERIAHFCTTNLATLQNILTSTTEQEVTFYRWDKEEWVTLRRKNAQLWYTACYRCVRESWHSLSSADEKDLVAFVASLAAQHKEVL